MNFNRLRLNIDTKFTQTTYSSLPHNSYHSLTPKIAPFRNVIALGCASQIARR